MASTKTPSRYKPATQMIGFYQIRQMNEEENKRKRPETDKEWILGRLVPMIKTHIKVGCSRVKDGPKGRLDAGDVPS